MRKAIPLAVVAALCLAVVPETVVGSPQPAPARTEPFVAQAVAPGTIGVKSSEAWVYGFDDIEVFGEVWNRTSTRKAGVKVIATWLNADNEPIGSESALTVLRSVAPGSVIPFVIPRRALPAGWSTYRLRVEPSSSQPGPASGPLEVRLESLVDNGVTRVHEGRVFNRGSFAVDRGRIALTVYDEDGDVNQVFSVAPPGGLDPGESWSFSLAGPADPWIVGHQLSADAIEEGGNRLVASYDNYFEDIGEVTSRKDIIWLVEHRITFGCGPARYCPTAGVPRDEMASFLARAVRLPPTSTDYFTDDEGNTHEADINRLRAAGITTGCTATTYCPSTLVKRDQMASLLARTYAGTPPTAGDYFVDDEGNPHETDINRIRRARLTTGCTPTMYCPDDFVTRGQMAAFIHRMLT